jgi:heme/copper-type cytochrome/quinol oxidase subunit 2
MDTIIVIRIVAGVLFVVVTSVLVYRKKKLA